MKRLLLSILMAIFLNATAAVAQQHEIGVTLGALKRGDINGDIFLPGKTSFTYQVDYAARIFNARLASLHFEVPLAVTPHTNLDSATAFIPRSYSSLFFTPGFKVKLVPGFPVSPYGVVGAGFARLNPSDTAVDGAPTMGSKTRTDFAYSVGGGLDYKVFPFISLRGEVKDFRTATPQFNFNLFKEHQHNVLFSAGAVLRF
jgi:opacity protein-like surface antigen